MRITQINTDFPTRIGGFRLLYPPYELHAQPGKVMLQRDTTYKGYGTIRKLKGYDTNAQHSRYIRRSVFRS